MNCQLLCTLSMQVSCSPINSVKKVYVKMPTIVMITVSTNAGRKDHGTGWGFPTGRFSLCSNFNNVCSRVTDKSFSCWFSYSLFLLSHTLETDRVELALGTLHCPSSKVPFFPQDVVQLIAPPFSLQYSPLISQVPLLSKMTEKM